MRLFYLFTLVLLSTACSSQYDNQSPIGESFPTVIGEDLENKKVEIPQSFVGKKTLLLVGYKQDSQFDIDRWLIGLDMVKVEVDVFEIPTIPGLFPRMFKTMINNGMRAGIPKSLWKGVITVYDDGKKIQTLTGNENPNNTRVILLDEKSNIIYFYDEGFSVSALNSLKEML